MDYRSTLAADFCWGVATSAYQVEGSVAADGRSPSIWDEFDGGDTGEQACDSYRRWPEDLALLKEMGVNSYRFSIAWPRVQPDGRGPVNAVGLDYYDRLVDDLLAAGIRPFTTLYHWDLPAVLQQEGGWVSRDTAYRFADYAGIVAQRLGDRVTDWVSLNEPLCSAWIGHLEGRMAPGIRDLRSAVHASYHLLLAHGLGVQAVRAAAPATPSIGIVNNLSPCEPASPSEQDAIAARRADGHTNRWWLDPISGRGFPEDMVELYGVPLPSQDGDLDTIAAPLEFLGLNYYMRMRVQNDPTVATLGYREVAVPDARRTALGWEVHPQGLEELLLRLAKDYDAPAIYVTENGSAWADEPDVNGYVFDRERADYLLDHVDAVAAAVAQGAPVKGYFAWSLLDNFEWSYGYWPRFGLAYVDFETQRRTLKLSGEVYAQLIQTQANATSHPDADSLAAERAAVGGRSDTGVPLEVMP
jgi:beta-glucosidase